MEVITSADPTLDLAYYCRLQKYDGFFEYNNEIKTTELASIAMTVSSVLIFGQAMIILCNKELRIHPMPLIMTA